jgi:flagellar protein FlbD
MIKLTRLDKRELCVNPDLIKCAEAIPDTMITFTTGERLYVSESIDEVRARFVAYQRAIRRQRARGRLAEAVGSTAAVVCPAVPPLRSQGAR